MVTAVIILNGIKVFTVTVFCALPLTLDYLKTVYTNHCDLYKDTLLLFT